MTKKLLFAMALLASAGSIQAAEYWVATNGNDLTNPGTEAAPFGSPEMALMSCKPGETTTIHLQKDATFMVGALRIEDKCNVILLGDNTTLKAGDKAPGPDITDINNLRILRIGKDNDVTISGVNFVNGRQVGYFPGGGIFALGNKLIIDNCSFINNMGSSSGGAICNRGHYMEVRNSYFEGNLVEGGGGTGAAIAMIGNTEAENFGELIVENCAFYKNHIDGAAGHGTVIAIAEPGDNAGGGGFSILGKLTVKNCTMLDNYQVEAYAADIDISDHGDCDAVIVNNTIMNCGAGLNLGFQNIPVYLFNNFIYAKKTAISALCNVAVDGREAIVAANNVLIGGEKALNDYTDDPMFSGNGNFLGTTADKSLTFFGIDSKITREGNIGYIITGPNSSLNTAGLLTSASYTDNVNYIPAADCRGAIREGVKCIGAYQYGGEIEGENGVAAVIADENAPIEYYNLQGVRVANPENGLYIVRQGRNVRKVLVK